MTTPLPEHRTASVLTEPKTIELRNVPVPALGRNQVLVKVESVGVCGSDTHFYETGSIGDIVVEGPVILGHESSGIIVAGGEDVASSRIGTRVSVEPQTDRKSTRLNSSHVSISYAVFCLKKKNTST